MQIYIGKRVKVKAVSGAWHHGTVAESTAIETKNGIRIWIVRFPGVLLQISESDMVADD